MEVLSVESIMQSYGGLQVLYDVSFSLEAGERVALIGPNGAGKTTLLNVLTGFVPPAAGRITFLNQNITRMPPNRRFSWPGSVFSNKHPVSPP